MKILYILIAFISLVILTTACQKEPEACLESSSTECFVGDKITFRDCSTDADHILWTFDDGSYSSSQTIEHTFNSEGTKSVKLEAYSKNGKKTDETSTTITVKPLYTKFSGNWDVSESWSSDYMGSGDKTYTITISQGASGNQVKISNFAGILSSQVTAGLTATTITIPAQYGLVSTTSSSWDIGSGSFTLTSSNTMTFTYAMDDILYANTYGNLHATGTAAKNGNKTTTVLLKRK